MKRWLSIVLVTFLLFGCGTEQEQIDAVISLRDVIQSCDSCRFDAIVTADYGDSYFTYQANCSFDNEGDMDLTVTQPDSISGITCSVSGNNGKLIFNDEAVAFKSIANGEITPISAPWIVMDALCGGYISSSSKSDAGYSVCIDDTHNDVTFSVDIWLNKEHQPVAAEIIWQGSRIVSMEISNFVIV